MHSTAKGFCHILFQNLLVTIICISITGCADDNNESNEPFNEPFNGYLKNNEIVIADIQGIPAGVVFNKIKADITGSDWQSVDMVEAEFNDGKAVLKLPATLPEDKLMKAVVITVDEDGRKRFDNTGYWRAQADKPDALVAGLGNLFVYNNQDRVGRVYLTNMANHEMEGKSTIYYHYAHQPVSLSGTYGSYQNELNFQQGWNAYANKNLTGDTGTGTVQRTTNLCQETNFTWKIEVYPQVTP